MDKNKFEIFIRRAMELGAHEAKEISASSIVTAAWVRLKCRFGCGEYGLGLCCPPYTPTPLETQEAIDCFKQALLIHCTGDKSPSEIIRPLEREIFLSGYYKALAFGSGPCRLCDKCSKKGCKHPDMARPSMEACGIDVFATAGNNGYPIQVLQDLSCQENCYGLILIE